MSQGAYITYITVYNKLSDDCCLSEVPDVHKPQDQVLRGMLAASPLAPHDAANTY